MKNSNLSKVLLVYNLNQVVNIKHLLILKQLNSKQLILINFEFHKKYHELSLITIKFLFLSIGQLLVSKRSILIKAKTFQKKAVKL